MSAMMAVLCLAILANLTGVGCIAACTLRDAHDEVEGLGSTGPTR